MANEKKKQFVEADTGDVEVKLVDKDNKNVARVYVPPFLETPVVLVWGGRFFVYTDIETDDYCSVYKEVFGYAIAG